jgi:hypothetical protein
MQYYAKRMEALMTSRRSILQGMAALWLGGWRGLGRKAVAAPATVAAAKAAPRPQPTSDDDFASTATIIHTQYDSEGRVISIREYCPGWRQTTTHYGC